QGKSAQAVFSSITITARKVQPSPSISKDFLCPSAPTRPVNVSTLPELPETFGKRAVSIPTMRVSNSQPDPSRQNPTVLKPNEFRQAYSPADGLAVRDPGKRKVQLVQCRVSCTEEGRKQEAKGGSVMNLFSSQPSYRSCIHHEVPLRCSSSVVFLDKSLCISLDELEGRRAGQPTLYRSALSVRLSASSCRRSSTDNKPTKTNEGYRRTRAAMLGSNKRNGRETTSGHCRGPLSKHWGRKVEQTASARGVNSKADAADTQHHSATLGILAFRGPSPSNTKAGRQKGNADEAGFSARSNFRRRQNTFNPGPGMNFITLIQK
uniref:Centrosomal protein C10orf90 N-terminal domain-containing protein n=1 Tax=Amphiprion percula TaxID=161767 RepID=A0A3P8SE09_AMPPE